ncbi:hypothetical protein [Glaciihabitans sp. UYNi722]|uniref:hypothetical protein n=1 Tax=Glaciihabitans sp. UYNi722 TaxID=3156344 RepID=UPI0033927FD0
MTRSVTSWVAVVAGILLGVLLLLSPAFGVTPAVPLIVAFAAIAIALLGGGAAKIVFDRRADAAFAHSLPRPADPLSGYASDLIPVSAALTMHLLDASEYQAQLATAKAALDAGREVFAVPPTADSSSTAAAIIADIDGHQVTLGSVPTRGEYAVQACFDRLAARGEPSRIPLRVLVVDHHLTAQLLTGLTI